MEILSTDTSFLNLLIPDTNPVDITYDNETLCEYVITLKNYEDLDAFYNDMETVEGDLYIPNRAVDLADKRPISRNTHYFLTQFEAEQIKQDPRVEAVDLTYTEKGIEVKPISQFSDSWSKQSTINNSSKNWGLFRSYTGSTVSGWGSDATGNTSGTINLTNIGRNVDVVICDGHIKPDHPEYAVNEDGTGGSRVIQYNWFQHNPTVRGSTYPAGTYQYTFPTAGNTNNSHGMHVAGIAAGNTHGWARGANIYNIYPYTVGNDNSFTNWAYYVIDYIRVFHSAKPINPTTGLKNPTIVNLSWALTASYNLTYISQIQFRGTNISKPASQQAYFTLYKGYLGLVASDPADANVVLTLARNDALDADILDAINSGIIMVGAAGNYSMYNDIVGGREYENGIYTTTNGSTVLSLQHYNRGGSPSASTGVINVSSVDSTVEERKADYSNAGPRTNIFAPGTLVVSATLGPTSIIDSRNSSYYLEVRSGTSQAAPQVTGILACALETYPRMTYTEALTYITTYSTKNQLNDPTPGRDITGQLSTFTNFLGLMESPNYYLKYPKEKLDNAQTYPKQNYKERPTSKITYPRFKRRLKG